jgi:hypothetical protein
VVVNFADQDRHAPNQFFGKGLGFGEIIAERDGYMVFVEGFTVAIPRDMSGRVEDKDSELTRVDQFGPVLRRP